MPTYKAPTKVFNQENANIEAFLNFKLTDGINIKRENYEARIEQTGQNSYRRYVKTDTGLPDWVNKFLRLIYGEIDVAVVENIIFDPINKRYECYVNDMINPLFKDGFSFKERYVVEEQKTSTGTKLVGSFDVTLDNRLNYLINRVVENKYFRTRYARLREELSAAANQSGTSNGISANIDPELNIYGPVDNNGDVIVNSEEISKLNYVGDVDISDFNYLDDDDIPQ